MEEKVCSQRYHARERAMVGALRRLALELKLSNAQGDMAAQTIANERREGLLERFEDMWRREQLDESAAAMLNELYI
jgi:hypothetical protein